MYQKNKYVYKLTNFQTISSFVIEFLMVKHKAIYQKLFYDLMIKLPESKVDKEKKKECS